jgi:hypothetical protein
MKFDAMLHRRLRYLATYLIALFLQAFTELNSFIGFAPLVQFIEVWELEIVYISCICHYHLSESLQVVLSFAFVIFNFALQLVETDICC